MSRHPLKSLALIPVATAMAVVGTSLGSLAPASALTESGTSASTSRTVLSTSSSRMTAATQVVPPAGTTRRVAVSTTTQLKDSIKSATPGTAILLHRGTYTGPFDLTRSGTADAPISIQPYGDGAVTLTATLANPRCDATGPDINRTVRFRNAASHWVVQGMTIKGGVYIPGQGVQHASSWMQTSIRNQDWRTLRAVPGRGTNDRTAADKAISYVAAKTGQTLRPIDGVKILDNTITGKGIHVAMSRYGVIRGNSITDILCGVGPGIWFGTYSDGWTVSGNRIARIAPSTFKHYMHEGIRIDNGSNYNRIHGNTVSDLSGDWRALNTDQTASYNTFINNKAANVAIGLNDQMAGWGNTWTRNTVTGYRSAGIAFRLMDAPLKTPSMATSTNTSSVTCNVVSGTGPGLHIGAMMGSKIANNTLPSVKLVPNVPSYWVAQGNTFNGRAVVPSTTATTMSTSTAC